MRARSLDFWRLLSLRSIGSLRAGSRAGGFLRVAQRAVAIVAFPRKLSGLFLRQHRFDEALAIRIVPEDRLAPVAAIQDVADRTGLLDSQLADRKGTRLKSSHA